MMRCPTELAISSNATDHWMELPVNGSDGTAKPLDTTYVPLTIYPILLLICTVGNIINILVLSRLTKVRIKELLLIALAVSDTFIMWFALPRYLNQHSNVFGLQNQLEYSSFLLKGYGVFTWLQYTFYYTSDWILVLFSCERLIAFHYPNFHRRIRSRLNWSCLVLLLVVFLSSLICLEHVVWYNYWLSHSDHTKYDEPKWLSRWEIIQKRADILLPTMTALTLLGVNIYLLLYLKKRLLFSASFQRSTVRSRTSSDANSEHLLRLTSSNQSNQLSARETIHASINMDVLLLGCVALYFFTQFPTVIFNILDYLSAYPHCQFDEQSRLTLERIQPIISTLSLLNYSGNFLVYAGLNRKYRQLSVDLLCGRGRARRGRFRRVTSNAAEAEMPLLRLRMLRSLSSQRSAGTPIGGKPQTGSIKSDTTRRSTMSSLTSKGSAQSQNGGLRANGHLM